MTMTETEKLQEAEIEKLMQDDDKEIYDLEQLILNGTDARIFIEIQYPNIADGKIEYVPVVAMIRPLQNKEVHTAQQIGISSKYTTANIEVVKKGLYTKDGDQFPARLVEKMPSGVTDAICNEILKASGVNIDTDENIALARKVMGF